MYKGIPYLFLLMLSSCVGTNFRRTLSIDSSNFAYEVRLSSKHHDVWFDVHDEESPDAKITAKAWVTNLGKDSIKTHYKQFDGKEPTGNLYLPILKKPLEVAHNERRFFFEGPIHLLGMSFTEPPASGTTIRIEVLFNKAPQEPLHGSFASNWGGP